MGKLGEVLSNPTILISAMSKRGLFNWMNDKTYYKMLARVRLGAGANLDHPKTFCEKMQWLKLNDRKPVYILMVDKYEAKKYVADRIGEKYIIQTIGVWDTVEQIDFNSLPNQYVLKTTHDSGGIAICMDKKAFDTEAAKTKLKKFEL